MSRTMMTTYGTQRLPDLPAPEPTGHQPMRLHGGCALDGHEAAVVLVEHRLLAPTDVSVGLRRVYDSVVRTVLRPAADVDAVADLLARLTEELAVEEPHFRIYPDGLGTALHLTLTDERRLSRTSSYASLMRREGRTPFLSRRAPSLYQRRGREQQGLLDRLGNARRLGLLHVEDGLRYGPALDRALRTYDRVAHDDRAIPPLIAALALAVYQPGIGGEPRAVGRDGRVYQNREAAMAAGSGAW